MPEICKYNTEFYSHIMVKNLEYCNKTYKEFFFSFFFRSFFCFLFLSKKPRNSHPEVLLGKRLLKIYSKFTGEHTCQSVISIKLLCNFIEIALSHGCSPVNLLHIFRTPFPKNTPGWLFLKENMSFIINTVIVSKMLVP